SDDQPRPTHGCDLLHENGTGLPAPRRHLRYPQAYLRSPASTSPSAETGAPGSGGRPRSSSTTTAQVPSSPHGISGGAPGAITFPNAYGALHLVVAPG